VRFEAEKAVSQKLLTAENAENSAEIAEKYYA
jgi:hypothetical protein